MYWAAANGRHREDDLFSTGIVRARRLSRGQREFEKACRNFGPISGRIPHTKSRFCISPFPFSRQFPPPPANKPRKGFTESLRPATLAKANTEGHRKSHIASLPLPVARTDDGPASEAGTLTEQPGKEEATGRLRRIQRPP